jgi:hypothetical protein
MELFFAIIIISVLYGALITYSIWFFWFGPEALFSFPNLRMVTSQAWHSITQGVNFMPAHSNEYSNQEETNKLKERLERLQDKRKQLLSELCAEYDSNKLRELNIVIHHIEVAEARINGSYNCPEADYDDIQIIQR